MTAVLLVAFAVAILYMGPYVEETVTEGGPPEQTAIVHAWAFALILAITVEIIKKYNWGYDGQEIILLIAV